MTGNRFRVISLVLLIIVFSLSPGVFADSEEISIEPAEPQASEEMSEDEAAEEETAEEETEPDAEAEPEEDLTEKAIPEESPDADKPDRDLETDTPSSEEITEAVNEFDDQGSRVNPSYIAIYGGVWDESVSATTMEVGP